MEKLTDQEEEIMLRIWRLGRCAVKQIMELLPEPRPPYTTVASIVNNLKRKEYVKAERDGKGYVYSPLIAESDYKRKFLSGFVNNYFKNSFKEMVSFFAKDEKSVLRTSRISSVKSRIRKNNSRTLLNKSSFRKNNY